MCLSKNQYIDSLSLKYYQLFTNFKRKRIIRQLRKENNAMRKELKTMNGELTVIIEKVTNTHKRKKKISIRDYHSSAKVLQKELKNAEK